MLKRVIPILLDLALQLLIIFAIASVLVWGRGSVLPLGGQGIEGRGISVRVPVSNVETSDTVDVGIQINGVEQYVLKGSTGDITTDSFSELRNQLQQYMGRRVAICATNSAPWDEVLKVYKYCHDALKSSRIVVGTNNNWGQE